MSALKELPVWQRERARPPGPCDLLPPELHPHCGGAQISGVLPRFLLRNQAGEASLRRGLCGASDDPSYPLWNGDSAECPPCALLPAPQVTVSGLEVTLEGGIEG